MVLPPVTQSSAARVAWACQARALRSIHCAMSTPEGSRAATDDRRSSDEEPRGV
jgi:hypothetical protein